MQKERTYIEALINTKNVLILKSCVSREVRVDTNSAA